LIEGGGKILPVTQEYGKAPAKRNPGGSIEDGQCQEDSEGE
jgi:hypothetical protein